MQPQCDNFFFKTVNFSHTKTAVCKNFQEIINFYQELGDQQIKKDLNESSSRSHYMSTVTVDEFWKLIIDHLEQELLNDITSAGNVSFLADETTDMTDSCPFGVYLWCSQPSQQSG